MQWLLNFELGVYGCQSGSSRNISKQKSDSIASAPCILQPENTENLFFLLVLWVGLICKRVCGGSFMAYSPSEASNVEFLNASRNS